MLVLGSSWLGLDLNPPTPPAPPCAPSTSFRLSDVSVNCSGSEVWRYVLGCLGLQKTFVHRRSSSIRSLKAPLESLQRVVVRRQLSSIWVLKYALKLETRSSYLVDRWGFKCPNLKYTTLLRPRLSSSLVGMPFIQHAFRGRTGSFQNVSVLFHVCSSKTRQNFWREACIGPKGPSTSIVHIWALKY